MEDIMKPFQLWTTGTIYREIELDTPKLASWDANDKPQSIAVNTYVDRIKQDLGPLPETSDLFLYIEIDVQIHKYLFCGHDLDNYIFPVIKRLNGHRFRLASAIKRVGDGSILRIGQAKFMSSSPDEDDWTSFCYNDGGISYEDEKWKRNIYEALNKKPANVLKPGSIDLCYVPDKIDSKRREKVRNRGKQTQAVYCRV
jgi:hypothetical protein